MYKFLLVLQVICVIMSLACSARILSIKTTTTSKQLMFTLICCNVYSVGYLQEMLSKSFEVTMASYAFQYMGLAFAALAHFLFVLEYCNVQKFPRVIKHLLFMFDCAVVGSVLFMDKIHIYYTKIEWDTNPNELYRHIHTEKGPLFYLFIFEEFALLIIAAFILGKKASVVKQKTQKMIYILLMIGTLIPLLGIVVNTSGVLGCYETGSVMLCFMMLAATVTLTNRRLVDVKSIAYSSLYENQNLGIIITDEVGNYLDSNLMANAIFPEIGTWVPGVSIEKIGITITYKGEEQYFEKDDHYYSYSCNRLLDRGRDVGYIVAINDITKVQEQVEEMKLLKDAANSANNAKSAFLANMSHEIRTPLNAIIGMAELSEKEEDRTTLMDNIGQIKSAGQMLLDIVSEVVDISKAESGKLELVPVEYDLRFLLNSVINVVNMRIGDKPVDFIVNIDPKIPRRLCGDDVRIKQIFVNFLGNAEKYTERGSIILTLDAEGDGKTVRIKGSVTDTGRGIKDEDKEKLFKPFSQVDTVNNHRITGSGLGLSIAAGIIDMMNGSYYVESDYGVGSTFFFEFEQGQMTTEPLARDREREKFRVAKLSTFHLYGKTGQTEAAAQKKAENSEKKYPDAKVLVVDDNKVNVKVLCAYLKRFGIVADSAFNGPDAIKMVGEKEYDLIFMDHMMPDMDGIEATGIIRAAGYPWSKKIKILACTANVVKGMEAEFIGAGMDDLVPKPVQSDTLAEKLAEYLS